MDCIGICTNALQIKQLPNVEDNGVQRSCAMQRGCSCRMPTSNTCKSIHQSVKVRAMQASVGTPTRLGGGHMRARTLYEVLGISQGACAEDIKKAYRKLARQFHPDVCVSPEEKHRSNQLFLQIQDAYSTLSDPHGRAQYDLRLSTEMQSSNGQTWNHRRAPEYRYNKMGRNWETDQCW
eukprot:Gb_09163 [translate_table: standard]